MAAEADYSTDTNRLISNHASSVASWETKETDSMHGLFILLFLLYFSLINREQRKQLARERSGTNINISCIIHFSPSHATGPRAFGFKSEFS